MTNERQRQEANATTEILRCAQDDTSKCQGSARLAALLTATAPTGSSGIHDLSLSVPSGSATIRQEPRRVSFSGGRMPSLNIEEAQRILCNRYGAAFVSTPPNDIVGFATATEGLQPINGLRHAQTTGTSGWYIWCGESFSDAADFFDPMHASHIYERLPDASSVFGLPPGYRFLLAGEYLDVWYDEKLLTE